MNQNRDPKRTLSSLNSLVKLYRQDAKQKSETIQDGLLADGADKGPESFGVETRQPMTAFEYRSMGASEKVGDPEITIDDFRTGIQASLAAAKRAPMREYIEGLESLVGVSDVAVASEVQQTPDAAMTLDRNLGPLRKSSERCSHPVKLLSKDILWLVSRLNISFRKPIASSRNVIRSRCSSPCPNYSCNASC